MDYGSKYKFTTEISYLFKNRIFEKYCQNKKVLDVGCGQGDYLQYFGKDSLGLDLSINNLEAAKNRGLRVKSFDFNKTNSLDESFDIVFASHILEHVENPINFLKFCNNHLNKDGKLILSIPNEISLIHMKYPYFTYDGNHLYSFTVTNIKELLKATDFKLENVYYDYYNELSRKLRINKLLGVFDFTPWIIKTPIAWAFWFIADKKS